MGRMPWWIWGVAAVGFLSLLIGVTFAMLQPGSVREASPDTLNDCANLGQVLSQQDSTEKTCEAFRLFRAKQYDEAVLAANAVVKSYAPRIYARRLSTLYAIRAASLEHKGKSEQAFSDYDTSASLNSEQCDAFLGAAITAGKAKRWSDVLEYSKKVVTNCRSTASSLLFSDQLVSKITEMQAVIIPAQRGLEAKLKADSENRAAESEMKRQELSRTSELEAKREAYRIALSFGLEKMPFMYLSSNDSSFRDGSVFLGKVNSNWNVMGERITYKVVTTGFKIWTSSLGGTSDTFLFDEQTITCDSIVVEKNPVGKWERSSLHYGRCSSVTEQKFPSDFKIWRRDDGAYVDSQRRVIITADYKKQY